MSAKVLFTDESIADDPFGQDYAHDVKVGDGVVHIGVTKMGTLLDKR